jgi:hypothetical protein
MKNRLHLVIAVAALVLAGGAVAYAAKPAPEIKPEIKVNVPEIKVTLPEQTFGYSPQIAQPSYISTDATKTTSSATTTNQLGSIVPSSDKSFDLGYPFKAWRNIYVGGVLNASGTSFSGNLLPASNNTYNIGSPALSWKDIYASGTLYLNNIALSGTCVGAGCISGTSFIGSSGFDIFPTSNNSYNLGYATSSWKNIFVSSTAYLGGGVSTTNIYPITANTYTLGSYSLPWKDIYASGTLYLGGLATSTLDSVTIGGSTPAAGTFTSLAATGLASFNRASSSLESVLGPLYVGTTATTTISGTVTSTFGAGLQATSLNLTGNTTSTLADGRRTTTFFRTTYAGASILAVFILFQRVERQFRVQRRLGTMLPHNNFYRAEKSSSDHALR